MRSTIRSGTAAPAPIGWRARVSGFVAVALGLAMVAVGLGHPGVGAQEGSVNFSATGDAFGSRIEVMVSQAPLFPNLIDSGGPTAQVALDSLGTARSIAAHPWPGDLIVGLPGLAAGLGPQLPGLVGNLPVVAGGLLPFPLPPEILDLLDAVDLPTDELAPIFESAPPLPPYPFAAVADGFDRPADRVDLGVGHLDATANRDEVTARAALEPGTDGVGSASSTAESRVRVHDDGGVTVEATGSIEGLRIGPLMIGSISSVARMSMSPSGDVTQESDFTVSAVQLGALSLDLTADGLRLAGTELPLGLADMVESLLIGSGIEIKFLEERITDTGVATSGLQITYPVDFSELPIDSLNGLGHGEVILTLGQSIVTMTGAPTPPLPEIDLGEVAPPPAGDVAAVSPPATSPEVGGATDTPPPPSDAPPSEATPPELVATRSPLVENFDAMATYLVIVGAALAALGTGQLMRVAAFRPRAAGP